MRKACNFPLILETFRSRPIRRQAQIDGDHVPSGIHIPMPKPRMAVFSATRKTDAHAMNLVGTRAARRGTTDAAWAKSRRVLSLRWCCSSTPPIGSNTENISGSCTPLESTSRALRVSVRVVSETGAAAQEQHFPSENAKGLWSSGCRLQTL